MGNCITENEDVGMTKKAHAQQATGANVNSDEVALAALALDSQAGLKQKLILNFSCSGLPNLDKASKSDTFVVLWLLKGNQ